MAKHSHKRDTNARLLPRAPRATTLAGSLAVLATASAVSIGVLTSDTDLRLPVAAVGMPEISSGPITGDSTTAALDIAGDVDRRVLNRGTTRGGAAQDVRGDVAAAERTAPALSEIDKLMLPKNVREAIRQAEVDQFTTADLNLWTRPGDDARQTGVMDAGSKVLLTGRSMSGREEIVFEKTQTRWVTSGYFSDEKPTAEPTLGGSCTNGTSVPSGVSPNIVKVHAAVCAAFPGITTYGTFRSDGEHAQGIAVDIMVSGEEGYRVADFLRANASALGVNYLIYSQTIWSVDRSSEGWRGMSDRGSTTANHYDHVHVTTY